MKPRDPPQDRVDLFRERLDVIIDPQHPLVRLASVVPWDRFRAEVDDLYAPWGRPGTPTRIMVGLHYLKVEQNISYEQLLRRWPENPYWQYFCGFEFLEHRSPAQLRALLHWRKRVGDERLQRVLNTVREHASGIGALDDAQDASVRERIAADQAVPPSTGLGFRLFLQRLFAR